MLTLDLKTVLNIKFSSLSIANIENVGSYLKILNFPSKLKSKVTAKLLVESYARPHTNFFFHFATNLRNF